LLSSTLFVTPTSVPADGTHFRTLQDALAAAVAGDTICLQAGFSAGTFNATTLSAAATAGATSIRTAAALDVGDVVSIGNTSGDPLERALVTGVSATGDGDFFLTLATPLQFDHTGSPVSAANASTTGPTIGINKAITLTADPGVVLPFNLEIWQGAGGVTLTHLKLTAAPATSLFIDGDGNTITDVTVANQLVLTNAHNNTLSGVTVSGRLDVGAGSSGNTVSGSALAQVQLRAGSHHNSFLQNTVGKLTAAGVGDGGGHNLFQQNAFNGQVKITGNATTATEDQFLGNTFTVASGDALTLEHATGTVVQGNTIKAAGAFANALVVHNSDNVRIIGNTILTTGTQGTGVYAYANGTGSTSVDVRNNVVHTGDGWGLYFAKYDGMAPLEARVQGNDLRTNAVGVYLFGDGTSAGHVDLGGDPVATRFGLNTGGNDFSTFTVADDGHYAVGLFATAAATTVYADNNAWGVADPLTVVADGAHTPAAFGSGVIHATLPPPPAPVVVETLTVTGGTLSGVQTGATGGVVATFKSNVAHVAGDFTATVGWGDGTTSAGIVVANNDGGFTVVAGHSWQAAGMFAFTVSVSAAGGASGSASGQATIAARTLSAVGGEVRTDKKSGWSGTVATFTDNLKGTSAASYVAAVAWSDGVTSEGTVVRNADGSFSVVTTRSFSAAGVLAGTVTIGTTDGQFYTTANLTATVTNKNDKLPGPKANDLKKLQTLVNTWVETWRKRGHSSDRQVGASRLK
jgi:hypothetical protein